MLVRITVRRPDRSRTVVKMLVAFAHVTPLTSRLDGTTVTTWLIDGVLPDVERTPTDSECRPGGPATTATRAPSRDIASCSTPCARRVLVIATSWIAPWLVTATTTAPVPVPDMTNT